LVETVGLEDIGGEKPHPYLSTKGAAPYKEKKERKEGKYPTLTNREWGTRSLKAETRNLRPETSDLNLKSEALNLKPGS
jgi:hypothetical protein